MSRLLWQPSKERIENANLTAYIKYVNSKYKLQLESYSQLYDWSIVSISEFWSSLWDFLNIIHSEKFGAVVTDLEKFPPKTKWFVGAKLNFAENLLRYRDDKTAIIFRGETKGPIRLSYRELYKEVTKLAHTLRDMGITKDDRVAAYMPNIPETVIAMLAATSIGATWSSCGAELGPEAAKDRLGQIEPKIVFTVDGYFYKEKVFDQIPKAKLVASGISGLKRVVVIPFVSETPDISDFENAELYQDFLCEHTTQEIEFQQVPFDHPLYIMFSSGTTGRPKCMVQSVGGILLNHLKELVLHTDMCRDDRLLYLSSPSWMMWNWMTTSLAVGSTLVLFEGNPLHPDWRFLWKFIQDEEISIFGCSASYLHHLKTIGAEPGTDFNLEHLREISQTGSSLSEEGFSYVYNEIKSDLHFNSISGGTDINGCFACGSPTLPVYAGQLQARSLGMKVSSYDEEGNHHFDIQGELVCELPSPSMPIYFWNDPHGKKYQDAYFGYFKGKHLWRHGDYIVIHKDTGGVTFYGRSDAVLKPSGVRIGTSEIYSIVENLSEVDDSLAIGYQYGNDQKILLFVTLSQNNKLNRDIETKIINELRDKASPRHVPSKIVQISDIPYTFSGKKVESAVTNILHGKPVTNKGALRNPESLSFFETFTVEF